MTSVLSALKAIGRRKSMSSVDGGRGGWFPLVRESYAGAWQNNDLLNADSIFESPALFACITLIAGDIAKMRMRLVELQQWGGWTETDSPAFGPVLRRPNRFQNHVQFKETWFISKLSRGNTYGLKERDARGVVKAVYILDTTRCTPLVADDGGVFYKLATDNLAGVEHEVIVPASEIIHDRFNCLFHPLVGLSPVFAAALPALQSLRIQKDANRFFQNNSMPGGILMAPDRIADEVAERMKRHWETNYSGGNAGKVAVLGSGLKFEPLRMSAVDAQVIGQLNWSAEAIAAVFHIPAYKINIGSVPSNNNVEALDSQYYTQCLHKLIEDFEACFDDGLGLLDLKAGKRLGVELDLSGLLRMDTSAKVKAAAEAIKAGFMAPNEGRAQFDLPPVDGGEIPYLQQQNFSLAALARRDAQDDPFATAKPPAEPPPDSEVDPADMQAAASVFAKQYRREVVPQ